MANIIRGLFGKKRDKGPMRDIAALVAPFAVPAVHVIHTDSSSLSHLGGSPRLPPDMPWPEHNGVKLAFLARLSLADLHRAHSVDWLPQIGALLFFYDVAQQPWGFDPKDRGTSAVLHVPDLPAPIANSSEEPDANLTPFRHRNVGFRRIDTIPSWERESIKALNLTKAELDEFFNLIDALFESMPRHQIAGFPANIQNDTMELECQLVTNGLYCGDSRGYKDKRAKELGPGAANWRLLFQFDTDDDIRAMWGDCGSLYFWIEEQAARAGDFSKTWMILQCH